MSEPDLDDFYADLENVNSDITTTNNNNNIDKNNIPTSTITTTSNSIIDNDNKNNLENKLKRKLDDIDTTNDNSNNSPTKKINSTTATTTTPSTTTNAGKALIPPSLMKKKQAKPIVKTSKAVTYSAPIKPTSTTSTTSTTNSTITAIPSEVIFRQQLQQQYKPSNYLNIAALKPQVTMEEPKKQTTIKMEAAGETWVDPTLSEWDENDFRIFVGDLGNDVTDDMLKQAFVKYRTFLKAKVIRDAKSGKSRGYGFVSFSGSTDFLDAMRDMNGKYVGNRPIKLRKSKWKDRLAK